MSAFPSIYDVHFSFLFSKRILPSPSSSCAWKCSISDFCLQVLMSQSACSKSWLKTSALLKAWRKSLMKTWQTLTTYIAPLAWMLHELLIYNIKTCCCIIIYLSISDSPGWLPWGFSHIQSWPLWHTLLSLFKYPVTSPSGPGTETCH